MIDAHIDMPGLAIGSYSGIGANHTPRHVPNASGGADWVDDIWEYNTTNTFHAHPDMVSYYIDLDGNLCVVVAGLVLESGLSHRNENVFNQPNDDRPYSKSVSIYTYDSSFTLLSTREITTPDGFEYWGGFHAGSDGYFYIAVGCLNFEQIPDKTVIQVLRYDRSWNETARVSVFSNGYIAIPFNSGNCAMTVWNSVLFVHTCTTQFMGSDGMMHQSNLSLSIDLNTFSVREDYPGNNPNSPTNLYISHSFQQILTCDGDMLYYLDQGDTVPRGLYLQVLPANAPLSAARDYPKTNILDFTGNRGSNYTYATAGAMEVGSSAVLIAGNSAPHNNPVMGKTGGQGMKRNIFLSTIVRGAGYNAQFRWITEYDPEGSVYAETPRLVKVDEDNLVLLYNVVDEISKSIDLHCVALDGGGNELNRVVYPDVYFAENSSPIYYNGDIVWLSPKDNDMQQRQNCLFIISFGEISGLPAVETPSSWAADQVNAAIAASLVPQSLQLRYTQATTRAEFCALAVALYETVTGREITERQLFSDTNDINVEKMAALDVVNGVGNSNFAPNTELTREQAATMLSRLAAAIGDPLPQHTATFSDNGSIASWALEAVGQMQVTGIMGGVGENMFSPKGPYTREQSIVTIMRLYDILKFEQ